MKKILIPKKSGGSRIIYCPDNQTKSKCRSIIPILNKKINDLSYTRSVVHGFMPEKSSVTNAQAHIGHEYTTCFDLSDFFDSITEKHLINKLSKEQLSIVMVEGASRQGLPSSPVVANIAATDLDKAILKWIDKNKYNIIYTRYADDLSFSYDEIDLKDKIIINIPLIIKRCGFNVNNKKTRTMSAKQGRRIITGVAVDQYNIHPTRKIKRKLRAALHQKNEPQAKGLAEWCKLKLPKSKTENGIKYLLKYWNLPAINFKRIPDKGEDIFLTDNIVITGDLVTMIGMSTITTGWTSCMRHPDGKFHKGVITLAYLKGVKIAALLSDKPMIIAGFERKRMRARALVFESRCGNKFYDRIYGNPEDITILENQLKLSGYKRTQRGDKFKVLGNTPKINRPYLDTLKLINCKTKENKNVWNFVFG